MNDMNEVNLRSIIEPLHRGKFWMQLLGVVSILYGVLMALSIFGILIAWIPVWSGVLLMQVAGATTRVYETGDALEMRRVMTKLKLYFTIFGVLMLLGIVIMVLAMIFGIGAGLMMGDMQGTGAL